MRVAAVDCGTNSIRLLVADVATAADQHATLTDVSRRMEVVRLGAGVDKTGRINPESLQRTLTALQGYADEARDLGAERVRMVATSATRDAENRADFVAGVREILGVDPEVATGDEEAALSFAGATGDRRTRDEFGTPYLVVDIGGGSTEFVLGNDSGALAARSVDIGCVRLTERHITGDQATAAEVDALVADVTRALDVVRETVAIDTAATLLGVAGTVTTVAGIALGLDHYDADRIHLSRLSAAQVDEVTERLLGMSSAERAALPVMHPGRVDVITAGALVLREVVRAVGTGSVVAGEHDILDGIALSLA
ncbi:MAG: exopolyphosphatase / guanosine-5-triphosphate,3-diphosphate pyrophosphatase [Frankiaceae bacterium]|nr:exopolyphosphatase / guanosine-5-triphosphate,3-diphosphate pyrophosphatase [Frankiaceae bacterium]